MQTSTAWNIGVIMLLVPAEMVDFAQVSIVCDTERNRISPQWFWYILTRRLLSSEVTY